MRCFTILGPSQTGKSTLAAKLGGLDGKPPVHDSDSGIDILRFTFLDEPWCAIDVPGGPESAGFAGPSLLACDMAVLCISPDLDDAVLAAPYLRVIEDAGMPLIIFINRMDTPQGRVKDIVAALQGYSKHALVLRQVPIREDGTVVGAVDLISERAWRYREGEGSALVEIPESAVDREHEARAELLEHLSDFDDDLLAQLVEDREPATGALYDISSRAVRDTTVVPVFMGAASHANGVMRLMKALRHETPQVDALKARLTSDQKVLAAGFHAKVKKHVGKAVFVRALSDGIAPAEQLGGGGIGGLLQLGGAGNVTKLTAGDIAITVKSDQLNAAGLYTKSAVLDPPDWARCRVPMYMRCLSAENQKDEVRLSAALTKLKETDPGLAVGQEETTGHPLLRLQGPMHLRRIMSALKDNFGVEATDRDPTAIYAETITGSVDVTYRHRKQSGGSGQFADVELMVRPQARGSGFAFNDTVKGGAVPGNYIPSVEAGARDALLQGPMGFPVVDIAVTLKDGKHHSVDSSDHAFRTAGRLGVKQALEEAASVLLQPIHGVEIHVPSMFSGAMVSLVSTLKGQVLGFDRDEHAQGWDVVRALLPASMLDELLRSLGGATQGTGWYDAQFDHYEEIYGREAVKISEKHAG